MTFPRVIVKSIGKVLPGTDSFYSQWRLQSGAVPSLQEDRESPPERLLQAVWLHQRLQREQLTTSAGETVRVLHPGFLSREGGPDFRGAVVQIGDAPPRSGDVEVDILAGGWHAHGHDRNPAFEKTILHVIWEATTAPAPDSAENGRRPRPEFLPAPVTLALRPVLDAPIGELSVWLNSEASEAFPESLRGHCCAPFRELSAAKTSELLREAAQTRFRGKAARLQARSLWTVNKVS